MTEQEKEMARWEAVKDLRADVKENYGTDIGLNVQTLLKDHQDPELIIERRYTAPSSAASSIPIYLIHDRESLQNWIWIDCCLCKRKRMELEIAKLLVDLLEDWASYSNSEDYSDQDVEICDKIDAAWVVND